MRCFVSFIHSYHFLSTYLTYTNEIKVHKHRHNNPRTPIPHLRRLRNSPRLPNDPNRRPTKIPRIPHTLRNARAEQPNLLFHRLHHRHDPSRDSLRLLRFLGILFSLVVHGRPTPLQLLRRIRFLLGGAVRDMDAACRHVDRGNV